MEWDGDPRRTIVVKGLSAEVMDAMFSAQRLGDVHTDMLAYPPKTLEVPYPVGWEKALGR